MKLSQKKILLTGGAGFLGSYVKKKLLERGVTESNIIIPKTKDNDLRVWSNCINLVKQADIVIHMAARVGGIGYNIKYPGTLFYDNAIMGIQLMEAARICGIEKFLAVGTVCAYPKFTPVPFNEDNLWNGYPEETNAPYGIAKKIVQVQSDSYRKQYGFNSIFLLPVNLYGPGDFFHLEHSHVIPALIMKFVEAKEKNAGSMTVWGTGTPSREFLYVEDAAEGILLALEKYNSSKPVNLGTSEEISIKDLVEMIKNIIGYSGKIHWDRSKPDGQLRRKLNISKAESEFGFRSKTKLKDGLKMTVDWYYENK
ncbi:MAG: GDP-L-fucose synthase family protein [Thermodesulfobacteriota bacterium]